jgi:hypothetical protein
MWSPPRIQTSPSGPLAYPFHFPEAPGSRVRAEMLRADRDFAHDELLRDLTSTEREALVVRWICRIGAVFAHEACDLARSRTPGWTLSRVESRVHAVLSLLALQAEHSKFVGGRKPGLTHGGQVREEVRAEIARSSEWSEYRDTLLDLLDEHADSQPDLGAGPAEEIGEGPSHSAQLESAEGTPSRTETATMPVVGPIVATTDLGEDRSKQVDTFLLHCNRESAGGFQVIRKHIWGAVGHAQPRQFQHWQKRSKRATCEDERTFHRILSLAPAEFIAVLKKKGISPSSS